MPSSLTALRFVFASLAAALLCGRAEALAEDAGLASLFAARGVEGTISIASLDGSRSFVHNEARAARRLVPASTFKIPNTLIILEEKAVGSKDEAIKWDGVARELPAWNRDQTLESAFKSSCVWAYQELSARVGAEKYERWLPRLRYGELKEPFDVRRFWLDGSLKISASEQISFLRALCGRELPFSETSYGALRQIMLAEREPEYAIWAKTGWAVSCEPQFGWYVGYVETKGGTWLFALNIDLRDANDLPLRQALAKDSLRAKGLLGN